MSRVIKFRAWNKDHGFIGLVTRLDFYNGLVIVDHPIKGTSHTFGLIHVDLMQFTGLKDSEGVEIYEGDVLVPADYKKVKRFNSVVIFHKGCFMLDLNAPLITARKPLYHSQNLAAKAQNEWAVIGNIHANPDLLT